MTSVPTNPTLPPPSSAPPVAPTAGLPAQGLCTSDPTMVTTAQDGGDPATNAIASGEHNYQSGDQGPGKLGVPAIVSLLGSA